MEKYKSDTVSVSQNKWIEFWYLVYVSDSFNCGPVVDTIVMKESSEIIIDVLNTFLIIFVMEID